MSVNDKKASDTESIVIKPASNLEHITEQDESRKLNDADHKTDLALSKINPISCKKISIKITDIYMPMSKILYLDNWLVKYEPPILDSKIKLSDIATRLHNSQLSYDSLEEGICYKTFGSTRENHFFILERLVSVLYECLSYYIEQNKLNISILTTKHIQDIVGIIKNWHRIRNIVGSTKQNFLDYVDKDKLFNDDEIVFNISVV